MSMDAILLKAIELGDLIGETEEAQRFRAANAAFESDPDLQELMNKFDEARKTLAQMEQGGDKTASQNQNNVVMGLYETIMKHDIMTEMTEANKAVQNIMNQVMGTINACISGSGCTGDCSGCSGCH